MKDDGSLPTRHLSQNQLHRKYIAFWLVIGQPTDCSSLYQIS